MFRTRAKIGKGPKAHRRVVTRKLGFRGAFGGRTRDGSVAIGAPKAGWVLALLVLVCLVVAMPVNAFSRLDSPSPASAGTGESHPAASGVVALPRPTAEGPSGSPAPIDDGLLGSRSADPTIGSAAPLASNALSLEIRRLVAADASPSAVAMLQHIAGGVQNGTINPHTLFLPNIGFFLGPKDPTAAAVSPFYTQAPAPMGIADVGIGAAHGVYEYNTSSFLGTTNLTSYNATAGSLYEDSGQYYWNGNPANEPGNPYDSSIQLNTVVQNVTFPGSSNPSIAPLGSGVFWTQNVLLFSGNTVQFVDNIWNFTYGTGMRAGTLYSYNGTLSSGYYFDVGPSIPVVYPVSVQLYNNASIAVDMTDRNHDRSSVSFGYRVIEGNGKVYSDTYDRVLFNSPGAPTIAPEFRVDGSTYAPNGEFFDAELVFGGPGDGSNAVITNLSGSMKLQYLPGDSSVRTDVPAANDYGTVTGETCIGVAEYWSGRTVYLNQGPSLLYGLWGATSGVPAGAIPVHGKITPNYAFVFIGEMIDGSPQFQQWAPSNATGILSTLLPPEIPGSATYSLSAYGAEYANLTGVTFNGPQPNLAIALTPSTGTFDAPLYMNGEAQASALATAIDGSAGASYAFRDIVDKIGMPFNILSDWGYPSFNLLFATGVSTPFTVDNVSQGPNNGTATDYFLPPVHPDGTTGDNVTLNLPYASQEYVDYGGTGDEFLNLSLPGYLTFIGVVTGGAISLWETRGVVADHISSYAKVNNDQFDYGWPGFGVWASTTYDTTVENSVADAGSTDFSVIASAHAVAWNDSANGGGSCVFDEGGTDGLFTYLNVTSPLIGTFRQEGSTAALGSPYVQPYPPDSLTHLPDFWANDTTVNWVRLEHHSTGILQQGGIGLTVNNVWANSSTSLNSSGVVDSSDVTQVIVENGSFFNDTLGVVLSGGSGVAISNVLLNDSTGVVLENGLKDAAVSYVIPGDGSTGVIVQNQSADISIDTVIVNAYPGTGVRSTFPSSGTRSASIGVLVVNDKDGSIQVTDVQATGYSSGPAFAIGVEVQNSSGIAIQSVFAFDFGYGVVIDDASAVTVSTVTAFGGPYYYYYGSPGFLGVYMGVGVEVEESSGIVITDVQADYSGFGVIADHSTNVTVSGLEANQLEGQPASIAIIVDPEVGLFPVGPEPTFDLNFNSTGLLLGTNWSVTLDGVRQISNATTISFSEPNGTDGFSVGHVPGLMSDPPFGVATVAGTTTNISVVFSPVEFPITLVEQGLPSGMAWSATVNGVTQSTNGTTMVFYLGNGTYPFSFNPVYGYRPSENGTSGQVSVSGKSLTLNTTYAPASSPTIPESHAGSTLDLAGAFMIGLGALVVGLAAAVGVLLYERRTLRGKGHTPKSP